MRCSAVTRKKKPCPIEADRYADGQPVCHVHDPSGVFQLQAAAKRKDKALHRAIVQQMQKVSDRIAREQFGLASGPIVSLKPKNFAGRLPDTSGWKMGKPIPKADT